MPFRQPGKASIYLWLIDQHRRVIKLNFKPPSLFFHVLHEILLHCLRLVSTTDLDMTRDRLVVQLRMTCCDIVYKWIAGKLKVGQCQVLGDRDKSETLFNYIEAEEVDTNGLNYLVLDEINSSTCHTHVKYPWIRLSRWLVCCQERILASGKWWGRTDTRKSSGIIIQSLYLFIVQFTWGSIRSLAITCGWSRVENTTSLRVFIFTIILSGLKQIVKPLNT